MLFDFVQHCTINIPISSVCFEMPTICFFGKEKAGVSGATFAWLEKHVNLLNTRNSISNLPTLFVGRKWTYYHCKSQ